MQSKNFGVCKSVELHEGCQEFLKEYEENDLQRDISAATELCNYLQVGPEFQSVKNVRHVKRNFHRKSHDKSCMTPEKKIQIEFFNTLLDIPLMSFKEIFEQLHRNSETCGFLYKISELPRKGKLIKHCSDLQLALTVALDTDN
jgi:hypothetical protein